MKNNYENNLNKVAKITTVDIWLAIIHLIRRISKSLISLVKVVVVASKSFFTSIKSDLVANSPFSVSSKASCKITTCSFACDSLTPLATKRSTYPIALNVIALIIKSNCLTLKSLYQKSKKLFNALFATVLLTSTAQANVVVTDPTSYGYYVEQLKTSSEQLKADKNLGRDIDSIVASSKEVFGFASDIESNFKKELEVYNNYRNSLSPLQRKKLDFDRGFDPKNLRDIIDTNLDGIFVDPDDPLFHTEKIRKARNYERQRYIKEALIKTETELAEIGNHYEKMAEYAKKAQNTKSPKAAADLTNALLLEIIKAITTLTEVVTTLGQAEMALKYTHYNKKSHENHVKAQKKRFPSEIKIYNKIFTIDEYRATNERCRQYKREHGTSDIWLNGLPCSVKAGRKGKPK